MKIAALQQKVDCLEKTVLILENTLCEKEEYIKSMQTFHNDQKTVTISCDESSRDEAMRKLTYDIIEFSAQLQQRDQFIAHQQETIDFLQGSVEAEHAELESVRLLKEETDEEIILLKNKVCDLEADLENTKEATQEMRNRLNATCRTIFTELKERFDEYCKQTTTQIESAEILKASNTELSELVAQQQEKCLAAQNDAAEFKKLLDKQEIDIKMLSSELIKIEEENTVLVNKVTMQNDKIQDLKKTIDLNSTNFLEKQLEYEKKEKECVDKIQDLCSVLKVTEEDKTQLELEKDLNNNELNKERKLNDIYCLRIEELKSIIRKKLNERKVQDEGVQEMKRMIRDSKAEQKSLQKELVRFKDEESRSMLKISEKETIVCNLQDALTLANTQACQQKQKVRELEISLETCQDEITNLKEVLTRTLTEQADSEEDSCKKTEEIKKMHLEMNCMKREKEKKIKEHLRVRKTLESELVQVRSDLQNAVEDLKKLKQSRQQMAPRNENKEEICHLKKLISERQYQLDEKEKELMAINCYNKELQELVEDKNTQLTNLSNAVETLQQELCKTTKELALLTNRNKKLECCNHSQKLEVIRLQKLLCDFQFNKAGKDATDQHSARNSAETQKSLEAQRKMTCTLIHQLNSAQTQISNLTSEKCNLEKLIGELKSLNECLAEEVRQMKNKNKKTRHYNDDVCLDRCAVFQQCYQGENLPPETGTEMFDTSKDECRHRSCSKRMDRDVNVARFGETSYVEDHKNRMSAQSKSYKRRLS